MDEDDSQDELINKTASSKGKRAALWAISDDSDDAAEGSEEGDSESGVEEEEEDQLEGEEDSEGEEEDYSDDEVEGDCKAPEGAVGEGSAGLGGLSSDEDADKCPICLNSFSSQPVATPESCEHYFCLDCILEWAKNANSCPVDRIVFSNIYLRKCYGGKVQKMITVQKPVKEGQEDVVDLDLEQTSCEVCGGSDREDRLLLCDGCDAGYHMECLTPPLDAVPVEEWFCPECEANNRNSRGSAEELSETDSLYSSARPTTSRPRPSGLGPTRAIARTQQSERVRAIVNRHRITQARTAQLAPRYLMQSTWLDETINAVVAGLNTAVYIRDLTPRARPSRRHKTVKRRKASGKKASSAGTGVRKRKRKVRRARSRKKLVGKKQVSSRGRIARSLGMSKPKTSACLPTVCRPTEHTLGSMRADIGAASLSVYGDPFDLDPFVDGEYEEQQAQVTSLLEAKRRGISHSALRSHQPVARPISASLGRTGMGIPQSAGVMEAAPVPDLLGSILSGQSMLLMDSSDVVINRDGSLKAIKPVSLSPVVKASRESSCSSVESQANAQLHGDVPGPSCSSSHSSPSPSPADLSPPLSRPRPHRPSPSPSPGHRGTNGACAHGRGPPRSQDAPPPRPHPKKTPAKPVWVDVAELPRIPKIKREEGGGLARQGDSVFPGGPAGGSHGNMPAGVTSLAGDRQQQPGRAATQAPRHRPGGQAGPPPPSSSAFSNSFSSSSSPSSGSPASRPHLPSSSTVSFRINSTTNSWHARRLSAAHRGRSQDIWSTEEEEGSRGRQRRDPQGAPAAASRPSLGSERGQGDAYDPFHPTLSEASSSDSDGESRAADGNATPARREQAAGRATQVARQQSPALQADGANAEVTTASVEVNDGNHILPAVNIKTEPGLADASVKTEPGLADASVKTEPGLADASVKTEPGLADASVKTEPGLAKEAESCSQSPEHSSQSLSDIPALPQSLCVKAETSLTESGQNVQAPSSTPAVHNTDPFSKNKEKMEIKSGPGESPDRSKSPSRSPARPSSRGNNSSRGAPKERRCRSGSPEPGRRREQPSSSQAATRRGGEDSRERSWRRRSRSRERRRQRSSSDSSQSSSSERARRKKRHSRSRSRDRRRARSTSSSREHSRRKKLKHGSKERKDGQGSDRDRGGLPKDKRRSRSRSRSRSRERRKDRTQSQPSSSRDQGESRSKDNKRARSRSRSKERRNQEGASKSSRKAPATSTSPAKDTKKLKCIKQEKGDSHCFLKENKDSRVRSVLEVKKEKSLSVSEVKKEKPMSVSEVNKEKSLSVSEVKKEKSLSVSEVNKEKLMSVSEVNKEKPMSVSEVNKEKPMSVSEVNKEKPIFTTEVKKEKTISASDVKKEKSISSYEVKKEKTISASDVKKEKGISSYEVKKEKTISASDVKKEKIISASDVKHENSISASEVNKEKTTSVPEVQMEANADTQLLIKNPFREIKKEKQPVDMFDFSTFKPIKKEEFEIEMPSPSVVKDAHQEKDANKEQPGLNETKTSAVSEIVAVKVEASSLETSPPWLPSDVPIPLEDPATSPNRPAPFGETQCRTTAPTVAAAKQVDSDEDFSVDMMLDSLDLAVSERAEGGSPAAKQEKDTDEAKAEGGKSKSGVKRVTWNIQEPEEPQPEKSASKLALYKLKLKQEGARRPTSSIQTPSLDALGASPVCNPSRRGNVTTGPHITSCSSTGLPSEVSSRTEHTEAGVSDEGNASCKDKQYLKKLHMQERAIEEVKLAIKPFYQNRDINKEEYKEIVRKAVQKVCHSKSGEINPAKVANLVKAYVDKYKHARKHKKGEDGGKPQTEGMASTESP